ncbi:MAG TPA: MBL fold metallo-hydrolase [Candidatus Gallimonas gallistercoris]|uniref:MBL fold metallo-hydrolase n=1 Tax=Candidatus Gallimonas gallistercoris TaxID=2838602 RepID=A0A9D2H2A5_9FIRM|nr:MBL fold metallo-hydrolase [Candidatus Gallimonas gallistercoris]
MKIRYLGHSCFLLTESTGTRILTDPYGDVGFKMPRVEADVVSVSHGHYDHNNVKAVGGNPVVLDKEGQYEVGGVEIIAVKSYHDNANGEERGENLIFKFRLDGIEVCHLGDLGEECSSSLIEMLLPVHVLLIPVGGKYTIDSEQAKEYVDRIMPSIVIPMHYKSKGLSLDIDKPDAFLSEFEEEDVEETGASEIELTRDDIDEETTKIILMERAKNAGKDA